MYEELAVRVEFFGDEIEKLSTLHPLTGEVVTEDREVYLFPASHYVAGPERMERHRRDRVRAGRSARRAERRQRLLEAQRLRMRTSYDIEMMRQIGTCSGIENYSRHIDGRAPAARRTACSTTSRQTFSWSSMSRTSPCLRSGNVRGRHVAEADAGGTRLPAAERDGQPAAPLRGVRGAHRPDHLSVRHPGKLRAAKSSGFVEQLIRPTGLVDPQVIVKPTHGQIDDLMGEIRLRTERRERVLVTTLTKKMSEDLTDYLLENGIRTPIPALRGGRCNGSSCSESCGPGSSTSLSASTCSGRVWTSRRCRWSPSSMPTKKGS